MYAIIAREISIHEMGSVRSNQEDERVKAVDMIIYVFAFLEHLNFVLEHMHSQTIQVPSFHVHIFVVNYVHT